MIKAIETLYKGYRFRSRTEARWAVFFDHLDWKWEYEAEGYHLPSGPYLPDFYFPEINTYAEVKGQPFTEKEKQKCKELSMQTYSLLGEDHYVYVFMLVGPPEVAMYDSYNQGEECCPGCFLKPDNKFYPVYWGGRAEDFYMDLNPAVQAALSARFEHGQRPQKTQRQKALQVPDAEIEAMWQKGNNDPQKISPEEYQKMLDYNRHYDI